MAHSTANRASPRGSYVAPSNMFASQYKTIELAMAETKAWVAAKQLGHAEMGQGGARAAATGGLALQVSRGQRRSTTPQDLQALRSQYDRSSRPAEPVARRSPDAPGFLLAGMHCATPGRSFLREKLLPDSANGLQTAPAPPTQSSASTHSRKMASAAWS